MAGNAPTEWNKEDSRVYQHNEWDVKVKIIPAGDEPEESKVQFIDQGTPMKINNLQPTEKDADNLAHDVMETFNEKYLETLPEVESTSKSISLAVRETIDAYEN
ncbi:hypothetical protein SG26_02690 [Haloarcula sp. CBA1115]|uniref:hypothetical protein n=1 Tax=unclassified Haloarcula TaxID=2624677 RepID=UPI00059558B9|nr:MULTISPECIES: hypothetical protein [unclassified Haloarcula]AJF24697.1 hypothetical protein SG26_02690 [Haloarcula sp. CBA1115]